MAIVHDTLADWSELYEAGDSHVLMCKGDSIAIEIELTSDKAKEKATLLELSRMLVQSMYSKKNFTGDYIECRYITSNNPTSDPIIFHSSRSDSSFLASRCSEEYIKLFHDCYAIFSGTDKHQLSMDTILFTRTLLFGIYYQTRSIELRFILGIPNLHLRHYFT